MPVILGAPFVAWLVWLGILLGAIPAAGQPSAATPSLALLLDRVDGTLVERIRGQTAELAWRFEIQQTPVQVRDAELIALGRQRGAHALIDVALLEQNTLVLRVFDVETSRVVQRDIPVHDEDLGHSAAAEAVALIVRSTLSDIDAGQSVGVRVPVELPTDTPKRVPGTQVRETPQLWLSAGWGTAMDGTVAFGQHGPRLQLWGQSRFWLVGAAIDWGLPRRVSIGPAELELMRQRIAAFIGVALWNEWAEDRQFFRVELRVAAGAANYARTTLQTDAGYAPTPGSTLWSPSVGPELNTRWVFPAADRHFSVDLTGALTYLPIAPTYSERVSPSEIIDSADSWKLQPEVNVRLSGELFDLK